MANDRVQLQLIRARQIRALYQRELTKLHRDRGIDDATRAVQLESLWQQATTQLARVRANLDDDSLPADERALFDPLARPVDLDLPD